MIDPIESAQDVGLKYVSDSEPGIRRIKKGKGFAYVDDNKGSVTKNQKQRIIELVIPPAWEDVWICKSPNGHLQVTGRDARKRKQYRYHEKWNLRRNETKFHRLLDFSSKLPALKKQMDHDLSRQGLPKEKVIAAVIKVMMITQSRIGNSSYAEENNSYGLTTIKNKHAEVKGEKIHLHFRGKSGVDHDMSFSDKQLSKIIRRCQELPGQELFCYLQDDGSTLDITSTHINDYLREITGEDFTAKDLRTWGGTCKAIELLVQDTTECKSETSWKKKHIGIIRETAAHLHNTVAVCRKYYVHPVILEADKQGVLKKLWKGCRSSSGELSREERPLLKLLKLSRLAEK